MTAPKVNPAIFASTEAHAREVKMVDGSVETFYFREATDRESRLVGLCEISLSKEERSWATAQLIHRCLCDADGVPILTLEEAACIRPYVSKQMTDHIVSLGVSAPGNV